MGGGTGVELLQPAVRAPRAMKTRATGTRASLMRLTTFGGAERSRSLNLPAAGVVTFP